MEKLKVRIEFANRVRNENLGLNTEKNFFLEIVKPQLTNTVAEDLADITVEEDKDKGALDEFLKSDDVEAGW